MGCGVRVAGGWGAQRVRETERDAEEGGEENSWNN